MKRIQIIAAGLLIAGMIAAPFASSQIQLRVEAGHHERHHVIHHPYHRPYHRVYHHRSRANVRIVVPLRHHVIHPQSDDHGRHQNQ